jgi:hypothetical protein
MISAKMLVKYALYNPFFLLLFVWLNSQGVLLPRSECVKRFQGVLTPRSEFEM